MPAIRNILNNLYAYVAATNVFRFQETNPPSAQYMQGELERSTNIGAATYYRPSSAGRPLAGFRLWGLEGVVSGGVTVTAEATNDLTAAPTWHDITPSLYNFQNNARGAASFVDTNFLVSVEADWALVRVKFVTSDGSNSTVLIERLTALS